jgi:hypothetical protein
MYSVWIHFCIIRENSRVDRSNRFKSSRRVNINDRIRSVIDEAEIPVCAKSSDRDYNLHILRKW